MSRAAGRAPRKPFTVGVIGAGFGQAHLAGFTAAGCRVIALCQRNTAAAAPLARQYRIERIYGDWQRMLDESRPDIVAIAAPPVLHRAIAERALAAGAHVLCEKPLAMSAAEARRMMRAARQAGRVAMTNFNWRFIPAMQELHRRVQAGFLGRLLHVHVRFMNPRWADEALAPTWRMDLAQAGHGAMGDQGVHLIDMLRWNFGEIRRVSAGAGIAYASRRIPGGRRAADAEDYCAATLELQGGALATLFVSRVSRGLNEVAMEACGTDGTLSYVLDRGLKRWHRGMLRAAEGTAALAPVEFRDALPASVARGSALEQTGKVTIAPLVARMIASIERGTAVSPSFEDGYRAQRVLDALVQARRTGGWAGVKAG